MWNKIIFSDESKFDISVGDCRKRIIRDKNEAFHSSCLKRTVKFAQGVMVWGCMSANGVGKLEFITGNVNAEKYQQILENSLLPSIETLHPDGNFIFQQDGASSHTAKSTIRWIDHHNMSLLKWPSSSPDLNVIETLWHNMKRHLRDHPQRTLPDLKKKIQQIWDAYTPAYCRSLLSSMPARVKAVIKRKGDVTSY